MNRKLPRLGARNCRQTICEKQKHSPFLHCAELILPWLTPSELANTSVTCKFLFEISKSITRFRSLDASRSLENISIPFHNAVDNVPYAYFFYTPSQITSSSCSWSLQRQFWGPSFDVDSVSAQREEFENRCGSVSDSTESKIKLGLDPVTSRLQEPDDRLAMETAALIDGLGPMSTERKQFGNDTVRFGVDSVNLVDESEESESGCECEKCLQVGNGNEIFGCPCYSGMEETGIVSECGPECKCGPECENRFTQRGITVRLKIVRDDKKGWCLFADQLITRGKFICEYAGELLTTIEARRRQQIYDELTPHDRISSALLVVREHLPSGKACLRMNIDATRVGNIARFINHSCDGGNLSTMLVRSSGALLPRLCFFTSKDINEGEELSFSYGEIRVRSTGLSCFCGSSCCFGTLPSEHT